MSCERDCVAMKLVRHTWQTTESAPFRCAMPAAPPPPLPSSAARFAACSRDLFALETLEPLPILASRRAGGLGERRREARGRGGGAARRARARAHGRTSSLSAQEAAALARPAQGRAGGRRGRAARAARAPTRDAASPGRAAPCPRRAA